MQNIMDFFCLQSWCLLGVSCVSCLDLGAVSNVFHPSQIQLSSANLPSNKRTCYAGALQASAPKSRQHTLHKVRWALPTHLCWALHSQETRRSKSALIHKPHPSIHSHCDMAFCATWTQRSGSSPSADPPILAKEDGMSEALGQPDSLNSMPLRYPESIKSYILHLHRTRNVGASASMHRTASDTSLDV